MASPAQAKPFTKTSALSLSKEDIGKFVGAKGSLIRKHVVNRARDALANHVGVAACDIPAPHVTIKHLPDDDVVIAECAAGSQELLDEVMKCISTHMQHVTGTRPAKKTPSPQKSSGICHLNFKTHMDDHLVGKYIGSGGKNCKALAAELSSLTEKIGASSIRVRVVQEDIYSNKRMPSKFFLIKNEGSEEVFIHVSAKFSGNPRDLFRAIKSRMISSVTSIESFTNAEAYSSPEPDYLGGAGTGLVLTASQDKDLPTDENGCYAPPSPEYSPSSPTYTPSE